MGFNIVRPSGLSESEAVAQNVAQNIIDSAPAALDTLNELAAALGDDADFATTTTNLIATKAPAASPTFTGTVVLPSTTSIGNISSTEIGYVDGVTSSIQTQLNAKLNSSTASATYATKAEAQPTLHPMFIIGGV